MKLFLLTATILLTSGLACFGETLNGHLLPTKCQTENPKTHTRDCALQCQSTGFGILTAKGEFVSFIQPGNTKAIELLRSTAKTNNLRVSVSGARRGGTLTVESIRWE